MGGGKQLMGDFYYQFFNYWMTQSETLTLLRQHPATDADEIDFLARTIEFVEQNEQFWQRSTLTGHLTGSAWILSADGASALLLHHAKLDRWLQPGGHVDESDASLLETARREAMEECGLKALNLISDQIFDLDVHEIPERKLEPAHFHYDLRFLFLVPEGAEIARNLLETKGIAWVPLRELSLESTPNSIRRMALKSLNFESASQRD
jgi:8-oxo-dGTP pyrophosphatase MutT (NUDIX family)